MRSTGQGITPGAFSTGQVWIGGPTAAEARFVPPPANHVPDGIAELERFIHGNSPLGPLIRTGRAATPLRVHRLVSKRALVTPSSVAHELGVTAPTARLSLEKLGRLGILEEITGRRRSRAHAYTEYPDLLNTGL